MLTAFYDFADLLVRKSDAHPAPAALDNQALAITMLSCVHDHTSSWQIFKDKAAQLQAEIAGTLPAELHTTAMMRGQTCALEELVKTLLGEVEAS